MPLQRASTQVKNLVQGNKKILEFWSQMYSEFIYKVIDQYSHEKHCTQLLIRLMRVVSKTDITFYNCAHCSGVLVINFYTSLSSFCTDTNLQAITME